MAKRQDIAPNIPCSLEAEQGFLGSMLLIGYDAVMDEIQIKPRISSFHIPANRTLFKFLGFMAGKGLDTKDPIAITQELKKRNLLDEVGGPSGITHLFTVTPTAANASYYAGVIEEKRILREIIQTSNEAIDKALHHKEEPQMILSNMEERILSIGENTAQECVTDIAIAEFIEQVRLRKSGKFEGGLKTGIGPWDRIGGIHHSRMYGIIARPGNGKTSLLEQTIINLLVQRIPVLVFQKDMPRDRFIGRMACRACNISYFLYEKGALRADQYDLIERTALDLQDLPLFLYDPTHLSAKEIHSIVRREKRRNGIKVWFLDYIQLLDVEEEMKNGLTKASIELKRCINATKVPGVIVAQLNRDATKGKPSASMIKEFDQLHADAGVIFCLYSEQDPHELKAHEPLRVQFLTDKNNFGPVSNSVIWFDRFKMTFLDQKPDWENYSQPQQKAA